MFVPVVFSLINKPTNGSFMTSLFCFAGFRSITIPLGGLALRISRRRGETFLVNASASDVFEIQTQLGGDQLLDFT